MRELASVLRVALQTMSNDQLEITDLHRILKRSASQPVHYVSTPVPIAAAAVQQQPVVVAAGTAPQASFPAAEYSTGGSQIDLGEDSSLKDDLAMVDRMKIEKTLERTNGNVSKAAAILAVSRETLHNKIRKYGIDVQRYRA